MCQEETLRGYPELAIWSLMRLSGISRIGSHHFFRSLHKSSQPDREGQSATGLALDRDVAAHHLTEVRLMATPRPVPLYLRDVADEIWDDSWNSSFTYLERDDFSSNRHPALSFCLSMIFSENRYPLFRIML